MDAPLHAEPLDVPAELALVAIDMEKYSQIPEARMAAARCDVDDVVATVLAECQLPDPQELSGGYKDSGDGGRSCCSRPWYWPGSWTRCWAD
ncbi:hypothetical protein ACH49O_19780 [Streptomyces coeruleorubidus]|uniref:hypothetical protein n=1 Tax=Streptomyces coeruleorubidus TaxID=116188 RepID=UPI0033F0F045